MNAKLLVKECNRREGRLRGQGTLRLSREEVGGVVGRSGDVRFRPAWRLLHPCDGEMTLRKSRSAWDLGVCAGCAPRAPLLAPIACCAFHVPSPCWAAWATRQQLVIAEKGVGR